MSKTNSRQNAELDGSEGGQEAIVDKPVCGIVMPISELDGCTETHWSEVQQILSDAIEDAGFDPNIVSNADEVGLIHKRIIQNLYDNPVVVCDVSAKNPNVMFELGLRLAFDKPTIIVKDDKTAYSFDTGGIEHIEYPRDLRFGQIVEFKKILSEKIASTFNAAKSDSEYTTFLKHFGEFKVVKLDKKEVSSQEFILDELRQIRANLAGLQIDRTPTSLTVPSRRLSNGSVDLCMRRFGDNALTVAIEKVSEVPAVRDVRTRSVGNHSHIVVSPKEGMAVSDLEIRNAVKNLADKPLTRSKTVGRAP